MERENEPNTIEVRYIVAIDPGLSGAIAVFDTLTRNANVYDMPTETLKNKQVIDAQRLHLLLKENARREETLVLCERQGARPNQGVSSTYKTGFQYGLLLGLCKGLNLYVLETAPQEWKKHYPTLAEQEGVKEQKAEARALAEQFFPSLKDKFTRVKDHGRAEACLIARYAYDALTAQEKEGEAE